MQPYDLCVVFGDDEMCCHQVWASDEVEAQHAIALFYKDSTIIGIVFAADDKGGN